MPAEPQTKLTWRDFANAQMQIESQAASRQAPSELDASRKAALTILHTYLSQYYARTNSYPTTTNLNDQGWVAANFTGIDPAVFRDPLATSPILSTAPKVKTYAYQTQSENPKLACANTAENPCVHYMLTATLSNGQPHVVQDP
jgi:hypothetical protein